MAPCIEKKQPDTVIPATIIPGFLYLGSYDTASRAGVLKTMNITHILNVSISQFGTSKIGNSYFCMLCMLLSVINRVACQPSKETLLSIEDQLPELHCCNQPAVGSGSVVLGKEDRSNIC
jgi:hypothetical protein